MKMPLASGPKQNKARDENKWRVFYVSPWGQTTLLSREGGIGHHNNPVNMIMHHLLFFKKHIKGDDNVTEYMSRFLSSINLLFYFYSLYCSALDCTGGEHAELLLWIYAACITYSGVQSRSPCGWRDRPTHSFHPSMARTGAIAIMINNELKQEEGGEGKRAGWVVLTY